MFRIKCFAWLLLWIGVASVAKPQAENAVLLDFYSDWCGPCQSMKGTVESLTAAGYPVERINIDDKPALAHRYGVTNIPCFVVVENGREIDRVTGVTTIERLKLKLKAEGGGRRAEPAPHPAWRCERPVGHRASIVRVFCQDGATARSIGSGTLVRWNGRLVILTARHVIKDAKKIVVELCTGRSHWARVIKVDVVWDCAVLELVGKPEGVEPAEVELGNNAMQQEGSRLESCGYGPDGTLACNTGLFLGYRRSTEAPNGPDDWLVISGHARGGDSGGPIFNERGRLVGVLWGTDGKEVVGVQAGRIHTLLDAAMEEGTRSKGRVAGESAVHSPRAILERTPTMPKDANCASPSSDATLMGQGCCPSGESARQSSLGQILGRKPIPTPDKGPAVVVQGDPEVRRSLDSIDAKVGVLVEQRQPKTPDRTVQDEPSPLIAGLCVLAAVAAGFVIYFGTQK